MVWIDRIVEFEVRVFTLLPISQLNNVQDWIIPITDIGHLLKVNLNACILSFGIQCINISSFIGPYAGLEWPTCFSQYDTHLQSELEE